MTILEELKFQQEWLALLVIARNDMASSGLAKRIEKGNLVVSYENLIDVNTAIRQTKSSIIILERGTY